MNEANFGGARARSTTDRKRGWRLLAGIVVVVLVALAVAIGLTRCARAPQPGAMGPAAAARGRGRGGGGLAGGRPPITVGVARASLGAIPINVSALGTVTPLATVQVQARVAGMLDRVGFKEGQMVRKGQLLAQIDPRPFAVAVDQADGQLRRDQAQLADAKVDLQRYSILRAQNSISGQVYDTQAALVRQYEGTVAADQAALANAKLNLAFTHVTAPVAGRVGLRQVDPGNQITANQSTPFTVVAQMDPITVVFSIPETAISLITRHGPAGLPVTVLDRAGGAVLATGRLLTLDNLIDPTTGTVKAKAEFANPRGTLFPNQFVNAVVLADTLTNQVVVPTTAVRHGPQGEFVWVLQANRTVKARPVTVGPGTPETVSLTSGLNVGETVITDGGDRLREGAKVILPGRGPSGGQAGGAGPGPGGGHHRWGGGPGASGRSPPSTPAS